MIYFMSTKTLVNRFMKDYTPAEILECIFIPVSSRISCNSDKYENVIENDLYSEKAIFAMTGNEIEDRTVVKDELFKRMSYSNFLLFHDMMLEVLIEKKNVIFLCTKNEMKTGYIRCLCEIISDLVAYPILDYKKYGRIINEDSIDLSKSARAASKCLDIFNYKYIGSIGNIKSLMRVPKKDLKWYCKVIEHYEKGMSKKEMAKEICESNTSVSRHFIHID